MFMNAHPRVVSHGLETFVPAYSIDRTQRGLYEIRNNDNNAWSSLRTMGANQKFQGNCDGLYDFDGSENLPVPPNNHHCSPELPPAHLQCHNTDYSRSLGPQITYSRPHLATRHVPATPSSNGIYSTYMSCLDSSVSDFGCNGLEWSPNTNFGLYHQPSPSTFASAASRSITHQAINALPSSAYGLSGCSVNSECFESDVNSPSTVYSCCSPIQTVVPDVITGPFTALDVQDDRVDKWWAGMSCNTKGMNALDFTASPSYDGLPRDFDTWVPDVAPSISFSQDSGYCAPLNTISAAAQSQINSCSALQGSSCSTSPRRTRSSTSGMSVSTGTSEPSMEGSSSTLPRRKLPTQPISQNPALASSSPNSQQPEKKVEPGGETSSRSLTHSQLKVRRVDKTAPKSKTRQLEPRSGYNGQNQIRDERQLMTRTSSWTATNTRPPTATTRRESKDEFLVRSKLSGMSYKEIRRCGGFTEAESTLRGRFRTLTKEKEERVRRPAWTENDIRLLKRAVGKLAHGSDIAKTKVPWKKVAEYIFRNGGSYQFGNATCRKKWDEFQEHSS